MVRQKSLNFDKVDFDYFSDSNELDEDDDQMFNNKPSAD